MFERRRMHSVRFSCVSKIRPNKNVSREARHVFMSPRLLFQHVHAATFADERRVVLKQNAGAVLWIAQVERMDRRALSK